MKFEGLAAYQGKEPYCFFSYSHKDAEKAEVIIRSLENLGFRIWYDEGLTPAVEWDEDVARHIENCNYLVALISQNYLESDNCKDELKFARDNNKRRLLIYLENVELPSGMKMRMGRAQSLLLWQYKSIEEMISDASRADGIEVCREEERREKDEGDRRKIDEEERERIAKEKRRKRITRVVILAGLAVAVLITAALLRKPSPDLLSENSGENTTESVPDDNSKPYGDQSDQIQISSAPDSLTSELPTPESMIPEPSTPELKVPELSSPTPTTAPQQITKRIAAGGRHTAYLWPDGTVSAIGDNQDGQLNTETWSDIINVSAGIYTTFGIGVDGTVFATGNNKYGQCDVSAWDNIVDISSENYHTLGLKKDGTVIATGFNYHGQCDVSKWQDIKQIATGEYFSVGLKSNGAVITTGENLYGQCDTSNWKNVNAIDAGYWHTVGLRDDGKVIAAGRNNYGQCNVSGWSDVVQISAGLDHTVALLSDGTVVATGNNGKGQCNVKDWEDIVYISTGMYTTVGIKADGRIVATGSNEYGQCLVSKFNS